MSHWAELDENNIVLRVVVGDNNSDDEGLSWIIENLGGRWEKTSYTSKQGNRMNPETNEIDIQGNHFRFNYALPGYSFDEERNAFIPPKPFDSWILNEQECWWYAPIPMPETGGPWIWNEELGEWEELPIS